MPRLPKLATIRMKEQLRPTYILLLSMYFQCSWNIIDLDIYEKYDNDNDNGDLYSASTS